VGLPHQRFDEAPHARAGRPECLARNHHERSLSPSLVALLPDLIYHLDEALRPRSHCARTTFAELASQSVKVVIGRRWRATSSFGGYDRYYGNFVRQPLRTRASGTQAPRSRAPRWR